MGALFGIPPYGGSIVENVYYADDKMCDHTFDNTRGWPERKDEKGNKLPWQSPFILMINRGGCTYVTKVRNAQRAGASAVVIADNICLCKYAGTCKEKDVPETDLDCEDDEPIMADDGSGSDISIPSFLMLKQDADLLKQNLMVNVALRMELHWSLPNPGDHIKYDLWTDPTNSDTEEFLLDFKEVALQLGERAHFVPHMYFMDGYKSGCQQGDTNICENMCTNYGRYCARDPDHNLETGVSGADMVAEILRRLCIWKNYGNDGIGIQWWNYVDNFIQNCGLNYFTDKKCLTDSMQRAKIDVEAIEDCMGESGDLNTDTENSLLESELKFKDHQGIVIIPSASVNDAVIRGTLEFSTMFKAVCAGYKDGTEPDICVKCAKCHDEKVCVDRGYCTAPPGTEDTVSKTDFIWTLIGTICSFIGVTFAIYKVVKRRMKSHIRGILSEYIPVDKNVNEFEIDPDDEFSFKPNP